MKHLRDNKIEPKKKITPTPLEELITKTTNEGSKSAVSKKKIRGKSK